MLPTMKQRLLIVAAGLIGGLVLLHFRNGFIAFDASWGMTLFDTRIGRLNVILLILVAAMPAILLGLLVSATGNPLSGVFSLSTALFLLAVNTGPADGFLWRSELPGGYSRLLIELVFWLVFMALFLMSVRGSSSLIRSRLPAGLVSDHVGDEMEIRWPGIQAVMAGLISAGIGGLLSNLMIQSTDVGQVAGSLMIAFCLSGFLAHLIISQPNPVVVLFSPILAGMGIYLFVWLFSAYSSTDAVLEAWYRNRLPGLALVLPVHYVSAGFMGSCMGLGFAQSYEKAKVSVAQA